MKITEINSQDVLLTLRELLASTKEVWKITIIGEPEMEAEYNYAIAKSKIFLKKIDKFLELPIDEFMDYKHIGEKILEKWEGEDVELTDLLKSLDGLYEQHAYSTPIGKDELQFIRYYKFLYDWENKKSVQHKVPNIDFWSLVHPEITKVSQSRYYSNQYADAVEAAFKEVIRRVKYYVIAKTNQQFDGVKAMNRAFGFENQEPLVKFNDLQTEEEKDEQRGLLNLFKGLVGIRNRKAHENIVLDDKNKAMQYLMLASLLLKIFEDRTGEVK